MKKIIILTALILTVSTIAMAQREGKTRFSIGPELGLATTNPLKGLDGNKGWGLGIGASAEVEHFFKENLSGIFHIGFVTYLGRSSGPSTKNKAYNTVPITVGGNAYVGGNFHVGAQIGVGINSYNGASATCFAYSPQIGYNFRNKNDKPLDLTLKYDGYAGNGNFG
ncbi:MAG: outer membrane beta-barrel protein, partial [Ginsengibacter sp.]